MPLAPASPVSLGPGSCLHVTLPQVLGGQEASTTVAKWCSSASH